jgi:hypothetical protein
LFNFSKKGAAKGRTLREQASELLEVRLWGIGAKTPNRKSLTAGDRVLIYVGAPEYEFIGHAELASPAHQWAPEEAARYPGSFEGGVAFQSADAWQHPVPILTILPKLAMSEKNPGAHFFSGVIRITQDDYATAVQAGTGVTVAGTVERDDAPAHPGAATISAIALDPEDTDRNLLFRTIEKLRRQIAKGAAGQTLSEYDTRAVFIDKYLEALGYTEIDDVQRGSPVESGNVPDYVLHVNGKPAIAIEAKKLGAQLGPKEAAQVVAYCSNLGVRWGAVSDGRYLKLYDAPLLGVAPHERLVLAIDLADYKNREDFEARLLPELELIAKTELESGAGLQRRVTQEAVRELLTSSESRTLKGLRRELDETKGIKVTPSELTELTSELLG